MKWIILFVFIVLMPNAFSTDYKFLKNRQQQRQIAKAIELQQSRARTKRATTKISRRTIVRVNTRRLSRRVIRRR